MTNCNLRCCNIYKAIENKHLQCFIIMLEDMDDINDDILHNIVYMGNVDVVKYLHGIGYTFSKDAISIADMNNDRYMYEYLIKN